METWLIWGIPIIVALQSAGEWLLAPMQLLSFLGSEPFYLLVMPAVVWCLDAAVGLRMGLVLLTSGLLNNIIKLVFGWPRPYWVSDQVQGLAHESTYGLPSGHAQNALAMWGALAIALRRRWATVVLGILIFLISLSRLYLGVHFPSDVLAGWAIAAILLLAIAWAERPVEAWLVGRPLGVQLLAPVVLSLGLLTLGLLVFQQTADRVVPAEWTAAASEAFPDEPPIDPQSPDGMFSSAGTLLGFGVGAVLLRAWGRFRASGPTGQRLARMVAGLLGIVLLYYGLGALRPHGSDAVAQVLRFLNYAIVGLWIAYGAPRVFVRLRLA
jgi:membrane-associated phospholipid phosphatase